MLDNCEKCVHNKFDFVCGYYCELTDEVLPKTCPKQEVKLCVTLDDWKMLKLKNKRNE